ncbi:hypothetical protein [Psychrobacter immobilis]|uniref:hypothetical protein n=1 Tax=Psychrobacter immobilis TaxID=498 RepID=UPI0019187EA2|nr:hypothetical protein [Psychrobacter immobilis]
MKLSIAAVALGWVLTTTLSGCSLSGASKSDRMRLYWLASQTPITKPPSSIA